MARAPCSPKIARSAGPLSSRLIFAPSWDAACCAPAPEPKQDSATVTVKPQPLLGGQIDGRRFASDDSGQRFRVFGRGEFTAEERFLVIVEIMRGTCFTPAVEENDQITFFAERDLQDLRGVLKHAENADDRRGVNRFPQRLIIK